MSKLAEHLHRIDANKHDLDAHRPLPPAIVAKLKEYFDIEWTHHSTAIEGNTLTLAETAAVLKHGVAIGGKSLREHLDVANHRKAIDFVESLASPHPCSPLPPAKLCTRRVWLAGEGPGVRVSEDDVKHVHAIVMAGIDDANAGKYRTIQVRIGGATHLPTQAGLVAAEMTQLMKWLDEHEVPDIHPVLLAAEWHARFERIHPFIDGSGRTGRLIMNLIPMRRGYPPAVIRFQDRPRYYDALARSDSGAYDEAQMLVGEAVERSLDVYLEHVVT